MDAGTLLVSPRPLGLPTKRLSPSLAHQTPQLPQTPSGSPTLSLLLPQFPKLSSASSRLTSVPLLRPENSPRPQAPPEVSPLGPHNHPRTPRLALRPPEISRPPKLALRYTPIPIRPSLNPPNATTHTRRPRPGPHPLPPLSEAPPGRRPAAAAPPRFGRPAHLRAQLVQQLHVAAHGLGHGVLRAVQAAHGVPAGLAASSGFLLRSRRPRRVSAAALSPRPAPPPRSSLGRLGAGRRCPRGRARTPGRGGLAGPRRALQLGPEESPAEQNGQMRDSLPHLPLGDPWAQSLASLSLSFTIYKMIPGLARSGCLRLEQRLAHKRSSINS